MTLLVRNESDVLRETLCYHRDQGVDHVIITTNRSDEPTRKIADEFAQSGYATVIDEPEDDFHQAKWTTRMARLAARRFRPRWIIHSDADEFWHADGERLASFFARVPRNIGIVEASRTDFVCCESPGHVFWERMIYGKADSTNALGHPLPPKVAHRPSRWARVRAGNHSVWLPLSRRILKGGLGIRHFPLRSAQQYTEKVVLGGEAIGRNRHEPLGTCDSWRQQLAEFKTTGRIRYLEENRFSPSQIAEKVATGSLREDVTLRDALRRILGTPPPQPTS